MKDIEEKAKLNTVKYLFDKNVSETTLGELKYIGDNSYKDGYKDTLTDLKKEINRMTAEGYKFPLLQIFAWIDKKLGLRDSV